MQFHGLQLGPLLREFPRRPGAFRVLATNLIPAAGFLFLGWSAATASLAYFADAFLTAAALTIVLVIHAMDETAPETRGPKRWASILFLFAFLLPFLSMPVTIGGVFGLRYTGLSLDTAWDLLLSDRAFQLGLAGLVAMHGINAVQWLSRSERRKVRDELREGFGVLMFKTLVIAVIGGNLGAIFALMGSIGQVLILLGMAALLTISEVYRAEVLKVMGVDRKFHDTCEAPDKQPLDVERLRRRRRRSA